MFSSVSSFPMGRVQVPCRDPLGDEVSFTTPFISLASNFMLRKHGSPYFDLSYAQLHLPPFLHAVSTTQRTLPLSPT